MKITGSEIEELTFADMDQQKETLKRLSEKSYLKCLELNLESSDPYLLCDCSDDDQLYDDINTITDELNGC